MGSHLLTVFAVWSTPTVRPLIGTIESAIIPQLREQLEAPLFPHVPGIVMTELTIAQKGHDLAGLADLLEPPLDRLLDDTKRRAQCYLATMAMLAPWRPSSSARRLRLGRLLHHRIGGFCTLLGPAWGRRTAFDTQPGATQNPQARHRLPLQRRKKSI